LTTATVPAQSSFVTLSSVLARAVRPTSTVGIWRLASTMRRLSTSTLVRMSPSTRSSRSVSMASSSCAGTRLPVFMRTR